MKKQSSTAKLILEHFLRMCEEQGSKKITPTNNQVAKLIDRGPKEVQRAIASLQEHGQVKVDLDNSRQPQRILEII